MTWQQRGLVKTKRILQVGAAGQELGRTFHKLAENESGREHHLRAVHGGVQFDAAYPEAVEERVEQVLGRDVQALAAIARLC